MTDSESLLPAPKLTGKQRSLDPMHASTAPLRRVLPLFVSLSAALGLTAQSSPARPTTLDRFAWFGCDGMTVNGNTKVYGVAKAGGAPTSGGDIASNGNITVAGNNTIKGNATQGPGKKVTITGTAGQVQGSTAPASAALTCEESTLTAWTSYAASANQNGSLPAGTLDSSRNLVLNGSKKLTAPAGLYFVNNVTLNGGTRLTPNGAVTLVVTGQFILNGNSEFNPGGNPRDLLVIYAGSGAIDLNGSLALSAQIYAPKSPVSVNGGFTGNGSVTWNRVIASGVDTTPPAAPAISHPLDGALLNDGRPIVAGTAEPLATLRLYDKGVALAQAPVDAAGAWSFQPATALGEGSHVFTATATDPAGNASPLSAAVSITIDTLAPDNTMGAHLELPKALSDTAVDTVRMLVYSHNDPLARKQFTLTETAAGSLLFKTVDGAMSVQIVTSLDPEETQIATPTFWPDIPNHLVVDVAGTMNGSAVLVRLGLLESGAGTKFFVDPAVGAVVQLSHIYLPADSPNTITATLNDVTGRSLDVVLVESAAGSRLFSSTDGKVQFHITQILTDDGEIVQNPSPETTNVMVGLITVQDWGMLDQPIELDENDVNSEVYTSEIETANSQ